MQMRLKALLEFTWVNILALLNYSNAGDTRGRRSCPALISKKMLAAGSEEEGQL